MANGTPLFRDKASTQKIAKEAVKQVYAHVGSPKDAAYYEQRKALALRFRKKYGSDVNGASNVNPFFIGVFDTVASLGSYRVGALAIGGLLVFLLVLSWAFWFFSYPLWYTFGVLIGITSIIAVVWYAIGHAQYAVGLEGYSFRQTFHFTSWKMQFYDKHLDNAVWYARHAMSIDEDRADFPRVHGPAFITADRAAPTLTPTGWTRSGFQAITPTLAGATPRTRLGFPISRSTGWSTRQRTCPTMNSPNGNGIKVDKSGCS